MNACSKCLGRAEDSVMLLEDTDGSVEPGTTVFRILGLHDKFAFIYSILLVILSMWSVIPREMVGPRLPRVIGYSDAARCIRKIYGGGGYKPRTFQSFVIVHEFLHR
jgi:hypothetical protein